MSLAENLRRPFDAPVPKEPGLRSSGLPASDPPRSTAVVKTLREVRKPTVDQVKGDGAQESFGLLDRASKSVVLILTRYRQLEEHVRQLDAWSKAQIQAAEASAARWQDVAEQNERKLQEAQKALAATSQRAEMAERDLKRDRDTLQVLQDRIIGAFGFGSEAHDALASIEID